MEPVVTRVVGAVQRLLGSDCLSICLYGSAVHGGLRPDSDVDLLVVAARSLSDARRRALTGELLRASGRPVRPVELTVVVRDDVVPWRYPPRRDFQYGEWLRDEFEAGTLSRPAADPDLAVLLTTVREHVLVLAGAAPAGVLDPVPPADLRRAIRDSLPSLIANPRGDERNVVLTLARMWTTLETGEIVSKETAGARVQQRVDGAARDVLAVARGAYLGDRVDDWANRTAGLDAFVRQAGSAIEALAEPG